jgi:hypothetical protein
MEEEGGSSYLKWQDVAFMAKINNDRAIPTPPAHFSKKYRSLLVIQNNDSRWVVL